MHPQTPEAALSLIHAVYGKDLSDLGPVKGESRSDVGSAGASTVAVSKSKRKTLNGQCSFLQTLSLAELALTWPRCFPNQLL
jgi:hypothetical protein